MDLAALIVAGLALVVSGWSGYNSFLQARYTRQSAQAAEAAAGAALEAQRQAASPEWSAVVVDHDPSSWYSLELRLTSSLAGDADVGDVSVEIPSTSRLEFSGGQLGVNGPSPSRLAQTYEPLLVGAEPAVWRVQLRDDGSSGSTNLRVTSHMQGMTWTIAVPVEVPYDMTMSIY